MSYPASDAHAPGSRLQIGEWTLDPLTHELCREDQVRRLPKRLLRVLVALAEAPAQTLTREQLLAAAWSRPVVADEVLSRAIAELRVALEDDARAPRYIETLPKTGYRLKAAVQRLAAPAAPATASAPAPVVPGAADAPARSARSRRRALALAALALAGAAMLIGYLRPSAPVAGGWTAAALAREQPFLSDAAWERQPRFSRDGRWLTYVSESPSDQRTRIWLAAADGSAARVIEAGTGRLSGPVLSPDGRQLAWLAREDGRCELRLLDLPAGAPRVLADCHPQQGASLDWSPQGALAYTAPATEGAGAGLWLLDPRSGEQRPLTRPASAQVADTTPRFAADGRLAFLRGPAQLQRIWLWQDARERVLVDSADRVPDLVWSTDGRQLLFASNRGGSPALHRLDLDSGEIVQLGGRGAATLDLAADGSLVYEQRRYDANLWAYRAGEPPRALSDSTRYDAYPLLSPDARQLFYLSNRDGHGSVWQRDLTGGEEQRIALPPALAWVRPGWDAVAGGLLLTRYGADHATDLHRWDPRSARLQALPIGAGFAAQRFADGRWLFGRGEHDGLQLWLQEGEDPPQPIAAADAVAEFRSDGRWLAWQRRGESGLRLLPLGGKDVRTLAIAAFAADAGLAWTVAAGELLYAARDAQGWAVWRQPLPDGPARRWLPLRAAPADAQIATSADLSLLVLSHIDDFEADLLRVPAPE